MTEKTLLNRLVLVGNGFDLAHNLKTSYNDFIIWYLIQAMEQTNLNSDYKDPLMTIRFPDYYGLHSLHHYGLDNVNAYVNYFYKKGFSQMLGGGELRFDNSLNIYQNPFRFTIQSELLRKLLYTCSNANWVDIENVFYDELKMILGSQKNTDKEKSISELNGSLLHIINYLETYLSTLDVSVNTTNYESILNSPFEMDEFVGLTETEQWNTEIDQTMILNFNYTSTIENYVDDHNLDQLHFSLNYIHGKIGDKKNRPVFGFGDELDADYANFESDKTKGIFDYIKSFWYFKTSNYHNLIRFIDSAPYQIYILGHSCGLSDRTMLNMIFEHKNCKSIKIFYHQDEDVNNYTALTQEISRHFKDKQYMRRKIVPFDRSSPMPQILQKRD